MMNKYITLGLTAVVSALLGATAMQTLHAQTKPPAYSVAEITVTNQDAYDKEYVALVVKALQDAGGKFIARAGRTVSYEGAPPAPRVVLIQWDNLDKLQALQNIGLKLRRSVSKNSSAMDGLPLLTRKPSFPRQKIAAHPEFVKRVHSS